MNPSTSATGSVEASAGVAPRRRSVLLVDDHPIVRQGLAQLINQEPDLIVSAEAATAQQAMDLLDRPGIAVDIAIVDISLEDRSGIELIKEIRARWPQLPILVLSMHDEALYAERALRAGARGYIMKQEATDRVMTAIRKVLGGEIYVGERIAARLLGQLVSSGGGEPSISPLRRLSDRELEIFTMIGRGLGTREIATKLFLSIKTVEAHREHIKEKLQLRSGTELMRAAVQYVLELPRSQ
ncbi:MAG TPA: response regulator transcription factor [Tepidisphaeraceae bacterium]|nr:response regulator transcription factor [Tepidisphaeraceae bacterium]